MGLQGGAPKRPATARRCLRSWDRVYVDQLHSAGIRLPLPAEMGAAGPTITQDQRERQKLRIL